MTIERLTELLRTNLDKAIEKITTGKDYKVIEKYLEQYDPKKHDIFNTIKRPWKTIVVPIYDKDGVTQISSEEKLVDPTRIAIPLQQTIVSRAVSFLVGNPIKLDAQPEGNEETLFEAFVKTWEDNKLDYESKALAKLMFSETECAELWYTEPATDGYWDTVAFRSDRRLRMRKLAYSLGDRLYPVFDEYGDMIAFGRGYYTINDDDQKEEHFNVYTNTAYYMHKRVNQNEWEQAIEPNPIGKIPVIYYSQQYPDWHNVQEIIDRLEKVISNHADTNDYNGSPMIKVKGVIKGFAAKGESGKVIELAEGADAEYMSWDNAPESIKLEIENLLMFGHTGTDTPRISPEEMKGIFGSAPSGYAIKLMFLNAHLKASDKEEIFGKAMQRRINYVKAALALIGGLKQALKLSIKPKFEYYLPKNDAEDINTLVTAVTGGIMSKETAVKQNPLIVDTEAEDKLVKEEDAAKQKELGLDNLMNVA